MGYTYQLLMAKLGGRCASSRKMGNHTYLEKLDDNVLAIRLHKTQILKFYPDGRIVLDSGGWLTITTRARMNDFLPAPWMIRQIQRVWYIGTSTGGWNAMDQMAVYQDGCVIETKKAVTKAISNAEKVDSAEIKAADREKRAVRDFAKKYMDALVKGDVKAPSDGDCWMCALVTTEGKALGEATHDKSHIQSHIEESYFVPALMARAVMKKPVSQVAMAWLSDRWHNNENGTLGQGWYEGIAVRQLQKALRRYMFTQLGYGD